jgi:hypothetical protein
MAKINYSLNVQVLGGMKVTVAKSIEVEATDSIDVTIPKGGAETEVQVLPANAPEVSFLMVTADTYGDKLEYALTSGGADLYAVDGPHLLIGKGGVALLDPAPTSFFFKNNDATADAVVHIFVGRDATP